jgi:hypothetical protein
MFAQQGESEEALLEETDCRCVSAEPHGLKGSIDLLIVVLTVSRRDDLQRALLQEFQKFVPILTLSKTFEEGAVGAEGAITGQQEV